MKTSAIYVIAEAGVNHNGSIAMARELIEAAARAGADAVKFQTFDAKTLVSPDAPKAQYQKRAMGDANTQLEMLQNLELPREWHLELSDHARSRGIIFLSSAFDSDSVAFLDSLDQPLFKIPSGELTNGPLLLEFARTRKRLIVSTGMANLSEVEQALAIIAFGWEFAREPASVEEVWKNWSRSTQRESLKEKVCLLHCTSQYPAPLGEVNLRGMDTLACAFGLEVGYSDHTEGSLVSIAAVARGASIIEKHFTLDRSLPGPDHAASLEPDELTRMVNDIRSLELILGDGVKAPQHSEWDTRLAARQRVVAKRNIREGEIFSREALTTSRACGGLDPTAIWSLVGLESRRNYIAGEVIVP